MRPETLLDFMGVAEHLKCNMRHSRMTDHRRESVAEHTYRLCVFAWLVKEEFPDCDMDKVMKMCLFHDLGEALTGDIPAFVKTDDDRKTEGDALTLLTAMLPGKERQELDELFGELEREETMEAKIVHVCEPELKEEFDPAVYDEQVGMMEMVLDVDDIVDEMSAIRDEYCKYL